LVEGTSMRTKDYKKDGTCIEFLAQVTGGKGKKESLATKKKGRYAGVAHLKR